MKNFCLDEGTIQAFLDGELAAGKSLTAANHVAGCQACALALAAAEEETSFAFAALENEYNTLVPTQRLWTKINDSIAETNKAQSVRQKISRYLPALFANPSLAFAAGILIFVAIFAVVLIKNPWSADKSVAEIKSADVKSPAAETKIQKNDAASNALEAKIDETENQPKAVRAAVRPEKRKNGALKISAPVRPKPANNESELPVNDKSPANDDFPSPKIENAAYLPGEESYVRTIDNLTQTVNSQKNVVLKPSAQISFARDLAVVDDAITRMKTEIKKNPKNEAAKQVLYSSYQNKIDLLSSVAEKNELMASLK